MPGHARWWSCSDNVGMSHRRDSLWQKKIRTLASEAVDSQPATERVATKQRVCVATFSEDVKED